MLTANCRYGPENPHRSSVHKFLNALTCYDNDYQRTNIELKLLREQIKFELNQLIFHCSETQRQVCEPQERLNEFQIKLEEIDKTKVRFNKRIDDVEKECRTILEAAKKCLRQMEEEKCQYKLFHQNTVNNLKKLAVQTNDQEVMRNCEKDLHELNKQFVKDMTYIDKFESVLWPFLKVLQDCNSQHCSVKELEWMLTDVVDKIAESIKESMGNVLTKVFTMIHIHQPLDVKFFAAAYLLNLEHNEEIVRKKMELIKLRK